MHPKKPKAPKPTRSYPPRINNKSDYDKEVSHQKRQIDILVKARKAPGRVSVKKKVKF